MIISYSLRKRRRDIINKFKFFLILFFSIFIGNYLTTNVYAETTNFYEAEYIDGIYMKKYDPRANIMYYQTARFFRKVNTNEFAYCIEPFSGFRQYEQYTSTFNPNNLTPEQIDRISKIAFFGYGYTNHTDVKWYAIAQLMIWQTADPIGDYFFSDTLAGNRISIFENEINEINTLINNYNGLPSVADQSYTMVEDQPLVIEDTNNTLSNFKTGDRNISINGNKITINKLKEGNYTFTLYKTDNIYNIPYVFYQSDNSQNLIKTGDISRVETKLKVKVIKTKLELNKIDKDTQSTTPQGEAELDGAIYKLYNDKMVELQELVIENNQSILNNLNFGKYYLKEITPGKGYTLDDKTYEININEENSQIKLNLENKVIEKKIIIEKKYGYNNRYMYERNISFNIIDKNNRLISTLTTDSNGLIEIVLPYGEYQFIQVNSTEGYSKVDPFIVKVENTEEERIELKDLKIAVQNTHTSNFDIISIILNILLLIAL